MLLFLIISYLTLNMHSHAADLYVPTPTLPSTFDPAKSLDVFSNSAIRQIHRSLFYLDASGRPMPDIVKKFEVENKGSRIKLILKELMFSDGTELRSKHVKASLERAIKRKTSGYDRFECIAGFKEFLLGKRKDLSGIKSLSKDTLYLDVSCPTSRMMFSLADLRYAILLRSDSPENGLGSYQVHSQSEAEVVLHSKDKTLDFDKIRYVKTTSNELNPYFKEKLSIIFLHQNIRNFEGSDEIRRIENKSWSNYFLTINAQRLDFDSRALIFSAIQREKLIKDCYPGQEIENNILPSGFPGYTKGIVWPKLPMDPKKRIKNLKVSIMDGVSQEKCVQDNLTTMLSKVAQNVEVRVQKASESLRNWTGNEVDMMFFYLESEINLDIIQFFSEDSDLRFGPTYDRSIQAMVRKINKEIDVVARVSSILDLQKKILESATVIPIFNPKTITLLSTHITPPDFGMIPPTYLNFSSLKIRGH